MKKLLNTLYITSEDVYLSLDGENVVANMADTVRKTVPLHLLEAIISFSYKGASPALMGKCAENGIELSFFTPQGRYLASVCGNNSANVLLRRAQFRIADEGKAALELARNFITGKIYNARYVLLRTRRDHPLQVDADRLYTASMRLAQYLQDARASQSVDQMRGIEGNAAAEYFGVFDELILQSKETFRFEGRNRRPPADPTNAMLSLAYALLTNDCANALNGVGLDPYVGFMHTDRPGRKSLALDMVEELRSCYADRFVLTLINNRIVSKNDFIVQSSGAVMLKDDGRRAFLNEWQKQKKETITHPFLKEKIPWGLVPHVQALLLARQIRGDLDQYPPFLWK